MNSEFDESIHQSDWGKDFDDQEADYWENYLGGPDDLEYQIARYEDDGIDNDEASDEMLNEEDDLEKYELESQNLFEGKLIQAVFIDLDGTLTDTADPTFKQMKDGQTITDVSKVKLIVAEHPTIAITWILQGEVMNPC